MSAPLDYLFPAPSLPKAALSPSHFPGVSPQSTQTLQEVLKDNHVKWHIFFNEKRFHNHAAHRAIAAWALGADPGSIRSGYKKDCGYEKAAFKSPQPITNSNFEEHLGDDRFYSGYVQFFTDFVKDHGIPDTLEQFIFFDKYNVGAGSEKPWMLSRFLSGVLHPMIHVGYGAEFELPGMLVEGLAMTCVTECSKDLLENLSLFEQRSDSLHSIAHNASEKLQNVLNTATAVADKVLPLSLRLDTNGIPITNDSDQQRTSADCVSILSRVLSDSRYAPTFLASDSENPFGDTIQGHGKSLSALVDEWATRDASVNMLIEELAWAVCVLYGIAGWTDARPSHGFTADFFLMHLVTSSIFLPALCALLPTASQMRLLKAYFLVMLVWAVARGQPVLDVEGFVRAMERPAEEVPPSVSAMKNLDLWMRIIEEAQAHHDEHVTKTVRSLAGWAAALGSRSARVNPDDFLNHNSAESAGLGMGLGAENELGTARDVTTNVIAREATADKRGPLSKVQCTDVDLDPRAWRDSKNGDDEDKTGFNLKSHGAPEEVDRDSVKHSELPGSDFLDGGLFLRIAILTLGRMGWDKDGGQTKKHVEKRGDETWGGGDRDEEFWDFKGFFDQRQQGEKSKENLRTEDAPKAKF